MRFRSRNRNKMGSVPSCQRLYYTTGFFQKLALGEERPFWEINLTNFIRLISGDIVLYLGEALQITKMQMYLVT